MAISLPIVTKFDDKGVNSAEKALKGLAVVGAAAFAAVAAATVAFSVEAAKAAAEAEAVTRGLENAAKNAGVFGDSAAAIRGATDALDAHSRKLGELIGIDDEIINQIKTGWLAVPDLAALGTEGINRLAEVTADIAAGTGKDVQTIGLAFQRIAGDTESAFSKLTRAGIVFTDEQKNTFEAIRSTSGEMAAQQYLVDELATKYAGAAESMANPFDRLNVIFNNLQETIGAAFLPVLEATVPQLQAFIETLVASPEFQAFLDEMTATFEEMMLSLPGVVTELGNFARDVLPAVNAFFPMLNDALSLLGEMFFGIENTDPASSTNDFASAMQSLANSFKAVGDAMKKAKEIWDWLPPIFKMNLFESLNPNEWLKRTGNPNWEIRGPSPLRVPTIPRRAAGGGSSNTGLSWVGEKGPELITMPRGATVTPVPQHMRADALLGSGHAGGYNQAVYNISVTAGMGANGAQLGEEIVNAIRKYERTSGAVFARA